MEVKDDIIKVSAELVLQRLQTETNTAEVIPSPSSCYCLTDCVCVCYRRLNTLNKCASMKLDVSHPKKKVSCLELFLISPQQLALLDPNN